MRKILLALPILFLVFNANAQDIHFSQYSATQPFINPALTGFFDGDYRIMGNFRMQSAAANSAFMTYGGQADVSLFKNVLGDDYFGVGGYFYQDKAGDLGLRSNTGALTMCYSLGFGNKIKHFLAAGFNFGVIGKSVDISGGIFPTGVPENNNAGGKLSPDLGFGLNYQIYFNQRLNVFIGQSVNHVNQPQDFIFSNPQNIVSMKFTTHAMAKIKAAELINIIPMFLFSKQASHFEVNGGVNAQFLIGNYEQNKTSFSMGSYGRFSNQTIDAVIFVARAEINRFQIGVSYDLNLNEFNRASRGSEAFELSIGYIGITNFRDNTRMKCPDLKSF